MGPTELGGGWGGECSGAEFSFPSRANLPTILAPTRLFRPFTKFEGVSRHPLRLMFMHGATSFLIRATCFCRHHKESHRDITDCLSRVQDTAHVFCGPALPVLLFAAVPYPKGVEHLGGKSNEMGLNILQVCNKEENASR
ncbi:hypothetical protein COLO4_04674 [Corchorus olitorius]|uniref:Uncharacterized protein n=1 Tax=Corchorus olitorius TaxID=93759 RepID=A0A1R3KT54_9ROSI|nr:hypothetical protein COLO4_04674 [Corchorus olitorius]